MAKYETALAQVNTSTLAGVALQVSEQLGFAYVVLRIRPDGAGVAHALAGVGLVLPEPLETIGSLQTRLVQWLSPDEFLITLPLEDKDALIRDLQSALAGLFAAVVDNSGGYVLLKLTGERRYDLLAKFVTYDVRGKLPVGKVVSTLLAKAGVILYRPDEDSLLLTVRSSFADYAWNVLAEGAEEWV